ncbi:DUF3606 domain-containing protein [Variovorax saccharolyticus]|uniref:DUF3606 domain-containing protein n=1 Tax=Variovorax saccharolyticus TaxID=3053516 RepID=UPI002578F3A1|nr:MULTISPECIES: DUF3606 domain-containing protein [unclassified Variovorax]MDM0022498.1 DUF3606 domain-containing protein [Variovorax sp. J22R187]MDM0028262.1 DUF3606 domain-containing protein [Variovorax sp. J31P216]
MNLLEHQLETRMTDHGKPCALTSPERIDVKSDASMNAWAQKLNVTAEQLKEAVTAVGDRASDVELHLKGSRSTTNDDRVARATGPKE